MEWISAIASIVTLVMFSIYLLGRIITIVKEVHFGTESFHNISSNANNGKKEHDLEIDFNGIATIEIKSSMAYTRFAVKEIVDYDFEKSLVKAYGRTIERINIQANTPIYLLIDLPEIAPNYVVEFERADGIKGYFEICCSGKTGEVYPMNYKLTHTFKSFVFYLCR